MSTGSPPPGWKQIVLRVKAGARDDNLTLAAAGISFFALLSVIPAMVAAISVYGLVADPTEVPRTLEDLTGAMPADARRLLTDQMEEIASSSRTGLSLGVVAGIVIALWGASTAMNHLIVALSSLERGRESRGYIKVRARALALTAVGIVVMGVFVFLVAVVPAWLDEQGRSVAGTTLAVLRWPLLVVLMLGVLAFLYRFAPDRAPRWRWISWGSATATALWLLGSFGFSFYVGHFGSYNASYGSMAAVVVLMLWLYITALCVLLGAEIDAQLAADRRAGERPGGST